jgi:hypothetical protein
VPFIFPIYFYTNVGNTTTTKIQDTADVETIISAIKCRGVVEIGHNNNGRMSVQELRPNAENTQAYIGAVSSDLLLDGHHIHFMRARSVLS